MGCLGTGAHPDADSGDSGRPATLQGARGLCLPGHKSCGSFLRARPLSHCPVLSTSEAMESGVQKGGRSAGTPVNTSCLWSGEHPASRPPTGEPAGAPQPGSEPLTWSNPKGNSRVSPSGVHSHKGLECFHAANALEPRCFGNKQQTRRSVLPENSERLQAMWRV